VENVVEGPTPRTEEAIIERGGKKNDPKLLHIFGGAIQQPRKKRKQRGEKIMGKTKNVM